MGRDSGKKSSGKARSSKAVEDSGPVEAIKMGVAAVERGDKDAAYRIFQQTTELHPDTTDAWVWLGGTSSNLDDAEAAFEKAYSLDPNNEQVSLGLRWVRLRRKAALNNIVGAAVPAPDSSTWSDFVSYTPPAEAANSQGATITCPNCGKVNDAVVKFCLDCGQDLRSSAVPGATSPGYIQPESGKQGMSRYLMAAGIVVVLVAIGIALLWILLQHH